jgi:hypothetical protein
VTRNENIEVARGWKRSLPMDAIEPEHGLEVETGDTRGAERALTFAGTLVTDASHR